MPNFFFDRYTEAGVSRAEFLTILHLSRYQYEKANSECRPSVTTVAAQMGYSVRGLQKVLAGMERRGLLKRRYRAGRATIYDFKGFSWTLLSTELLARSAPDDVPAEQLALALGGEPQFTPTGEPGFTTVVNPSSPEEQHKEQQTRNDVDDADQNALKRLLGFGVDVPVARKLARVRTVGHVSGWIAYANGASNLRDPVGFVVRRLLDDVPVPAGGVQVKRSRGGAGRSRQVVGFTCPGCGQPFHIQGKCCLCGQCEQCCECQE